MKSADEHLSRDISSLKRDGRIRPISMEELRKRYGDELRAMNHVPEDLADMSDFDSCSAMDCTGLMPALPLSEAELESYEDLYRIFPKAPEESGKV